MMYHGAEGRFPSQEKPFQRFLIPPETAEAVWKKHSRARTTTINCGADLNFPM